MKEMFDYVESLAFSIYAASFAKNLDHLFDILESDPIFLCFLESNQDIEAEILDRLPHFEQLPICEDFNPYDPTLTFYLKVLAERHSSELHKAAEYISSFRCSCLSKSFANELLKQL
jgi:hypothetical protein